MDVDGKMSEKMGAEDIATVIRNSMVTPVSGTAKEMLRIEIAFIVEHLNQYAEARVKAVAEYAATAVRNQALEEALVILEAHRNVLCNCYEDRELCDGFKTSEIRALKESK